MKRMFLVAGSLMLSLLAPAAQALSCSAGQEARWKVISTADNGWASCYPGDQFSSVPGGPSGSCFRGSYIRSSTPNYTEHCSLLPQMTFGQSSATSAYVSYNYSCERHLTVGGVVPSNGNGATVALNEVCVTPSPNSPPPPPPPPPQRTTYGIAVSPSREGSICPDQQENPANLPQPKAGNPVALSSGAECPVVQDIAPGNGPLPLGFVRYYNSRSTDRTGLGRGWTQSYSRRIEVIRLWDVGNWAVARGYNYRDDACVGGWDAIKDRAGYPGTIATVDYTEAGDCQISHNGRAVLTLRTFTSRDMPSGIYSGVRVIRDSGRVVRFTMANNAYVPEEGVSERLYAHGADGLGYRLVTGNGHTEIYDADGKLLSIADRAGNTQTLSYDNGLLQTVLDSSGRQLSFTHALHEWLDFADTRMMTVTGPDNRQYRYAYTDGQLSAVTSPSGYAHKYAYTDTQSGGLTAATDEHNQTHSTWDYDNLGRVVAEQKAGNVASSSFSYAGDGTVTVTDPLGAVRQFSFQQIGGHRVSSAVTGDPCDGCGYRASTEYDAAGYPSRSTDAKGNVTLYTYDAALGLPLSVTEAAGTPQQRTTITTYWPALRLPRQIKEPTRRRDFGYDPAGNLTSYTELDTLTGLSRRWAWTYNGRGQVLTADGPRTDVQDITYYSYNECNTGGGCMLLNSVRDAAGHVTTIDSYDAAGRPTQVTDPNGLVTQFAYNPRGWLTSIDQGGVITSYNYYLNGLLSSVTLPGGEVRSYHYDSAHRLKEIRDGSAGNRRLFTLDAAGNRTAERVLGADGTLHRYETRVYDKLSRLWKINGGNGQITELGYDDNGNLTSSKIDDRVTTLEYDALDRLLQVMDPAQGLTRYGYRAQSELITVTDPRNLLTRYTRNGHGEITQLQSPDSGTGGASYDEAGNLKSRTDAKGQLVTYSYDVLNRITQAVYQNGPTIAYTYDQGVNGKGRLTSLDGPGGSLGWAYDLWGRVLTKTQVVGARNLVTRYSYDNHGRPATQTLPSGKVVAYQWTAAKLTGMTLDGQPLVSGIQEIPFGPIKQWTFANGEQVQRTFDRSGRMTGHSLGTISYDTADRITGLTQGGLSQLTGSKTYGYDALDRLTSYLGAGYGIGYGYDANGNRTQQTAQAGTTNYAIDPLSNRVNSLSINGVTQSFSYDANGSLTGDGLHAYGYDATGRLASVDGSTAYGYNGLGQRVSKSASGSGTVYAYDEAGRMLGEYDVGTGNAIQETVWMGDTPVAMVKASGTYYVHADHLNTPRQIDDANGAPVWAWDTITFGASTPDEDPLGTGAPFVYNLRHPGQYFDAESGLLQNWHRDYNPGLGRYVQSDPIGLAGGLNSYLYGEANPLSYIDPLGLQTTTAGAPIADAVASATRAVANSPVARDIARRALAVSPYSLATACLLYTSTLDAPDCEMPGSPNYGKCWMMNEEKDDQAVAAARNPYDHNKPGRKKQGREPGEKKRSKPGWKPRNPPKEPPRHTPSRKD